MAGGLRGFSASVLAAVLLSAALRSSMLQSFHSERRSHEREEVLRSVLEVTAAGRRELFSRLHDGPLQTLLAGALELENANARKVDTHTLATRLQASAAELRDLIRGAEHSNTSAYGLEDALRRRCELARTTFGDVHFLYNVQRAPADDIALIAYHIAQEAIANAQKHSRGTRLDVAVTEQGPWLALSISDDGVGIDTRAAEAWDAHWGLATMRERAEMAGGQFEINSQSGLGTRIAVFLPRRPITAAAPIDVLQRPGRRK
jgi:signal transduction histidine kinase